MNVRTLAWRPALPLLLSLAACGATNQEPSQVAEMPEVFLVLGGATDTAISPPNATGEQSLSYWLTEVFPAQASTRSIRNHLKEFGYVGRTESLLNPGLPLHQGDEWESFGDAASKLQSCVRQWWREWENEEGTVVTYILRYKWAESDARRCGASPASAELLVAAIVSPRQAHE